MIKWIIYLIVWTIAIVCIFIMKKAQPDSYKGYAIWVVFIMILLTIQVSIFR